MTERDDNKDVEGLRVGAVTKAAPNANRNQNGKVIAIKRLREPARREPNVSE